MNDKYIYEFFINHKKKQVICFKFPILSESHYTIFIKGMANKKRVYRGFNKIIILKSLIQKYQDLLNILSNDKDSTVFCLTCPKDFDGKKLYNEIIKGEVSNMNNNHKYIYELYTVPENLEITKERFPVVYESDTEVVFVKNKGTTVKVYKNTSSMYISFKDIISNKYLYNFFNANKNTRIYCMEIPEDFDGRKLYAEINKSSILMKIDNIKHNAEYYIKKAEEYSKEYRQMVDYYKSLGIIEGDENEDIKLAKKEKEE